MWHVAVPINIVSVCHGRARPSAADRRWIAVLPEEGKATHVCPFHMAQDQIQEGAALIFITYSQLVDPVIRRAGGLDAVLEDAVVVVDEGHNLPSVARDAASYEVTEDRLADMVKTLEEFAPHLGEYPEAQAMLESLIAPPPGSFAPASMRN